MLAERGQGFADDIKVYWAYVSNGSVLLLDSDREKERGKSQIYALRNMWSVTNVYQRSFCDTC